MCLVAVGVFQPLVNRILVCFFFVGKGIGSVYLILKSKLMGLFLKAFLSVSIHSTLRFSVAFFSTYTLTTFQHLVLNFPIIFCFLLSHFPFVIIQLFLYLHILIILRNLHFASCNHCISTLPTFCILRNCFNLSLVSCYLF